MPTPHRPVVIAALLWAALPACTAIDVATLPGGARPGEILITQETLQEPYDSVGLLQITRKGVHLVGFADPAGTDLAAVIEQVAPEIRYSGADVLMNARVEMTQYTLPAKLLGLLFFFIPQPAEVTISGELVRRRSTIPGAQPVPGPQPTGGPL